MTAGDGAETTTGQVHAGLLEEIERAACEWAREAGARIVAQFRQNIEVQYKRDNRRDPVTEADHESEAFLKDAISRRFPSHGVLGEEGAETAVESADFLWVLDPLDGTTNFSRGLPFFGVSIGVLYRRRPVAGCIYLPTSPRLRDGVYHARLGGGAWFEDERLAVPTPAEADSAGVSGLPGSFRGLFRIVGKPKVGVGDQRSLGSIAYEIAMVADGALQSAFFARPKIWDVAAGAILVREAGGSVLGYDTRLVAWRPLDRFETPVQAVHWLDRVLPPPPSKAPVPAGLRAWSLPLVFGAPAVAEFYARYVRHRPPARFDLVRQIRRRLAERRQARRDAATPEQPAPSSRQ